MTPKLLLAAGLLAATQLLHAQNPPGAVPIALDEFESQYSNNFDGRFPGTMPYEGTVATLPMGVQSNYQTYLGKSDGSTPGTDGGNVAGQGGYYAFFTTVGTRTEVAMGLQNDGADPMYYEFTFRNDGVGPIYSVRIGYTFEQYRYINTSGITATSSLGDVSSLNQAGDPPIANMPEGPTKGKQKDALLNNVNIAPGATFTIRFAADAQGTNGNNGVGIDDLTVTVSYNIPLPVQLVSFAATPVQSGAVLNWATASEQDNAFFGVEMSRDGLTFEEVGRVSSKGNDVGAHEYDFNVSDLQAGQVYFRLAQTDFDGVVTLSPVTSALIAGKGKGFSVLANYATDKLQLDADDAGSATIVDVAGRHLRQVRLVEGRQEIDITDLATGMYFLSDGETTVRFVK